LVVDYRLRDPAVVIGGCPGLRLGIWHN
jgi:hypothetical protein